MAPELKELQEKYKDDKQRQQQEIMKFYAENKVNPFASCLPLLAQLPFFIGLYYMLQSDLRFDICGHAARGRRGRRRQAAALRADPESDRRRAVPLRPRPDRRARPAGSWSR